MPDAARSRKVRLLKSLMVGVCATLLSSVSISANPNTNDTQRYVFPLVPISSDLSHYAYIYHLDLGAIDGEAARASQAIQSLPDARPAHLHIDLGVLQLSDNTNSSLDWLAQGETLATNLDSFLTAYKATGARLDKVSLTYDLTAMSASQVKARITQGLDDRFNAVVEGLGFANDLASMYEAADDSHGWLTQEAQQKQLQWNQAIKQEFANYLDSLVKPLQTSYSSVEISARNYYEQLQAFHLPTSHFDQGKARTVGTTQAQQIMPALPASTVAFDRFKASVDHVRSMTLSSDKPIQNYVESKAQTFGLSQSDLYQEMLIHAVLSGANDFIYNNKVNASDTLPADVLAEVETFAPKGTTKANVSQLTQAFPFVLSVANVDQQRVWRFTPALSDGESAANKMQNEHPASFVLNDRTVIIPDAAVVTQSEAVSSQGVWLQEQAGDAVQCEQPQVGRSCEAFFSGADVTAQPALVLKKSAKNIDDSGEVSTLVEHDWKAGGAGFGTPVDNFAYQVQQNISVAGGEYEFTLQADDSVALWVDDQVVIDGQRGDSKASRELKETLKLTEGEHQLRLEYKDYTGDAAVKLSAERLSCDPALGQACVVVTDADGSSQFIDLDLSQLGAQAIVQTANGVRFDFSNVQWPEGVDPTQGFQFRWNGAMQSEEGAYGFNITHGTGDVALALDNDALYQVSNSTADTAKQVEKNLQAGSHTLSLVMRVVAGSHFNVTWDKLSAECAEVPEGRFCGAFYENRDFTGTAKRISYTDQINYNWDRNAPFDNVSKDNFAARWVGDFVFDEGTYTFSATTDDGVRVWVDDKLVIDRWRHQSPYTAEGGIHLSAGKHRVKMEYFEGGGHALAKLEWKKEIGCDVIPENQFCAEYFNNRSRSGAPEKVVAQDEINFDWKKNAPLAGINKDNFSVRWLGDFDFEGGEYHLEASSDDKMKVWIGEQLLYDTGWRTETTAITIPKGQHRVLVEYYEGGGHARAKVNWTKAERCDAVPTGKFCGEYYTNHELKGAPVKSREDAAIDFLWKTGSPIDPIPSDRFSVHWKGNFEFEAGEYNFNSYTDDGVVISIDGNPIIDSWSGGDRRQMATVDMTQGTHLVEVKYREWGGHAYAMVDWDKGERCDVIPDNKFCGEYFTNHELKGAPVHITKDKVIDYYWKSASPAEGVVPKDRFSVRWQGNFDLEGDYRFIAKADDGMRVWINDELIIDAWTRSSNKEKYVDMSLEKGKYHIKVESYENWGWASTKFVWEERNECKGVPEGKFCGTYFANEWLSSHIQRTEVADKIDFNWEQTNPMHSIPKDRFSVRWEGNFDFPEAGYYQFKGFADDGIRVWVDDQLIINQWSMDWRWRGVVQATPKLTAGKHKVKVEYRERYTDAKINLDWKPVSECNVELENAYCLELYENRSFSGIPKVVKKVTEIDNEWGYEKPDPMVWKDNYSARWTGKHYFEKGTYRFKTQTDDGVRVWIGDDLIFNRWYYRYHPMYKTVELEAGWYDIKMENNDYGGPARAKLSWEKLPACSDAQEGQFCAEFFDNREFKGVPVDIVIQNEINQNWRGSQPTPYVPRDKFSVRWTTTADFDGGLYRFLMAGIDDGMRVKVDGNVVMDVWKRKWPWYGDRRQLVPVTAGKHKVEVEYREDWGQARAQMHWEKAPDCDANVPIGEFCAAFFDGKTLDPAKRIDTRIDKNIDFHWTKQPHLNVWRDNFSARWVGNFDLAEGEYTFTARADDGVRVWIDDELVIDEWRHQGARNFTAKQFLTGGTHTIKMEYFEGGGHAVAKLDWEADQTGKPATPAELRTTKVTQESVSLAWEKGQWVDHFKLMRNGQIIADNLKEDNFVDSTVEVTKSYNYSVIAVWKTGTQSEAAKLKVDVLDVEPPTQPASLRVAQVSPTQITLMWDAANDNVGVTKYQVLRDNSVIAEVTGTHYIDQGLANLSKQTYQIIALDNAANQSEPSSSLSTSTYDGTAPTIPTQLEAAVTTAGIELGWQAASDNVAVAGYIILRDGQEVGRTNSARFVDENAGESQTRSYQVKAYDSAGNQSAMTPQVTVVSGDATSPNAPNDLTAKVNAAEYVELTWNAAQDNVGIKQYRIIRDGRVIAMTEHTSFVDRTVDKTATYTYVVKAIDDSGNSSIASNGVEINLAEVCESNKLYYQQHVANAVTSCTACHTAGGQAQNSGLIFVTGNDASERNLNILNSAHAAMGKQHIISKASGSVSHGGNAVLQGDALTHFSTLLDRLADPVGSCSADSTGATRPSILTTSLAANCMSCHGFDGASAGPGTPSISSFDSQYFSKVMHDYQTGDRAATVMDRIAKGYSTEEINHLADFYATQPVKIAAQTDLDTAAVDRGRELHQNNCASCHTAGGRDKVMTGTRLAGQWFPYLHMTLKDYAAGHSTMPASMESSMQGLSADDLKALSAYYASAQPDTAAPEVVSDVDLAAYTADSVTLTWMDSFDDWEVSHYEIYRDGILVGTSTFSVFTDTGLNQGTYNYTIVAVDQFGNKSEVSSVYSATLSTDDAAPVGIQLLDHQATLRKATTILLQRMPTTEELAAVTDEETLRTTLRGMFDQEGALDRFTHRAGHEVFLSQGAARINDTNRGASYIDFPNLAEDSTTLTSQEMRYVRDAIKSEPVFLLQYIVNSDKPWTDIVAADYTVLNGVLAKALGATPVEGGFADPADNAELKAVRIDSVSKRIEDKAYPHAGVLTTNSWLSRFPTTDSNRNRHRSAKVFKQFLGIDIEALAQRPLDDSNNGDFLVPTMENPSCMTCHTSMDPVAGAFRNWGDRNRYFQNWNGERGSHDSLARSYRSSSYPKNADGQSWYRNGDVWYRDVLAPGFGNAIMPGGYSGFGGESMVTSENLLTNPKAENGIEGWEVGEGLLSATNKTLCSRTGRDPQEGQHVFQLGQCETETEKTVVWQDVDIKQHAEAIDAGKTNVHYGAFFTSRSRLDRATTWVEFLDEAGEVIESGKSLSDNVPWQWRGKQHEQVIPENTRTLRFVMQGKRSTKRWADKFIDAYVDNAYMLIETPNPNVVAVSSAQDSLQWLAHQMTQDQRFAKGGVHFWYRALFKRLPLAAPVDPNAADYGVQMAAYNEQDVVLEALAKRFTQDQGHGAWNVKDLLINMILSPLFRAQSGVLSDDEKGTVPDLGVARLLTPEELSAKVKALTGSDWDRLRAQNNMAWRSREGQFYGGFDGGNLQPTPNTEMNSLMSRIPERMGVVLSCGLVNGEFGRDSQSRKLFPYVTDLDTPISTGSSDVNDAHNLLINAGAEDGLTAWVQELGETRVLSGKRGCNGGPSIHNGQAIFNPGSLCQANNDLAKAYQVVDVTAWQAQIDAGQAQALFGAALSPWSTNNDEVSVYLNFYDANGNELEQSDPLMRRSGGWKVMSSFAAIPEQTRTIRFYMQGRKLSGNTDTFVDDTYLRLIPMSDYQAEGEKRIRANIQYLHKHLLNESLALDDPEIDRTYALFKEIWAEPQDTPNANCDLYRWRDPNNTKRAWNAVLLYLMTDAKFLYE